MGRLFIFQLRLLPFLAYITVFMFGIWTRLILSLKTRIYDDFSGRYVISCIEMEAGWREARRRWTYSYHTYCFIQFQVFNSMKPFMTFQSSCMPMLHSCPV